MTDRRRFTYHEAVFARPPGFDEADDIALTNEVSAAVARFLPEDGVHTSWCRAVRDFDGDPDVCVCSGGYF